MNTKERKLQMLCLPSFIKKSMQKYAKVCNKKSPEFKVIEKKEEINVLCIMYVGEKHTKKKPGEKSVYPFFFS